MVQGDGEYSTKSPTLWQMDHARTWGLGHRGCKGQNRLDWRVILGEYEARAELESRAAILRSPGRFELHWAKYNVMYVPSLAKEF